ncbi:MAG: NGG1p interacting factor NIF3 [Candidatus Omnitrophota bacterium]|jgi:putative NIF3 family GTP cyclohydrolase 1 type 2
MKLLDFYNQAVCCGAAADPRRKDKRKISFSDSAILYGDPKLQVKKIMVGIDIEVGDLLLADRVRQREGLDLVLAHHPEGKAYAGLYKVMELQKDLLEQAGVKKESAAKLIDDRIFEVERGVLPQNHTRPVDAARILDLPFMNLHTPADNQVHRYLEDTFKKKISRKCSLEGVVKALNTIEEYRIAGRFDTGPRVILGNPKRPAGKIMLEMTGGTEGPKDAFEKIYRAGIRTLVSMHLSEGHLKKAREANLNVVIAGHISSDTLGLNLLLDKIEKQSGEEFEIISCSGFQRVKRG